MISRKSTGILRENTMHEAGEGGRKKTFPKLNHSMNFAKGKPLLHISFNDIAATYNDHLLQQQ